MRHTAIKILFALVTALVVPHLAIAQAKLENPLQFQTIADFIAAALRVMVMVALPVITLFIVYAGAQFVLARGNQEGLKRARENFMYVILGALLILGAWVIATMIGGTVTQLLG